MAGTLFRCVLDTTLSFYKTNITNLRSIHTASTTYAARKGTRAKARAKKIKVEITKIGFVPHNLRGKKAVKKVVNKHLSDSNTRLPVDDVYPRRFYQMIVYSAEDAVKGHQETHHPTMYNRMDAFVSARIELNMTAAKKTRTMDSFTRLVMLPHSFPGTEERTILAFCKTPEMQKLAVEAGATAAGGHELVKKIQEGVVKLPEFEYVLAHPNMITEMVPIRGLMKRRFPNVRTGTLDVDIAALVKKFANGIQYRVVKDENQPDFGNVEVPVGKLTMDIKQISSNIEALLKDIQSARPKREGLFVTRCWIVTPNSKERFKIDPFVFIDREMTKEVREESDDEDEVAVASA